VAAGQSGAGIEATLRRHPHLLDALNGALSKYHRGTAQHAVRVRELARLLGAQLKLRDVDRKPLYWAAWIHDLGKLGVPAALLSKNGRLTTAEWVEMRRHPAVGGEILVSLSQDFEPIAAGVRSHHERWDGSGYPDGLTGDSIPRIGRVVAVADVFDATTHRRAYRDWVYVRDEAVAAIEAQAGTHFDPSVVAALRRLYSRGKVPASN